MRVKNRLLNFSDMIIYQDSDYFAFSLDSVLLANFVSIRLTDKKIIDFCSGNAPVPMLLSYRTKARLFGVELQKEVYKMGRDSIAENKLDNRIEFINVDVKKMSDLYDAESFDVVTCNPPYFKYNDKYFVNVSDGKAIARHEIMVTLEEIVKEAAYLLKTGGTLALVHRPDRLVEIIDIMRKYNIEPKRMKLVYPKKDSESNMLLIEGRKNSNAGLKIEKPLIVHDDAGNYVLEIKLMFDEGGYLKEDLKNVAKKL